MRRMRRLVSSSVVAGVCTQRPTTSSRLSSNISPSSPAPSSSTPSSSSASVAASRKPMSTTTTTTTAQPSSSKLKGASSSSSSLPPSQLYTVKKPTATNDGLEEGIGGFQRFFDGGDVSLDAFIIPQKRREKDGVLPCDPLAASQSPTAAASQTEDEKQEQLMAQVLSTGKLPSPKRDPQQQPPQPGTAPGGGAKALGAEAPSPSPAEPTKIRRSSLPKPLDRPASAPSSTPSQIPKSASAAMQVKSSAAPAAMAGAAPAAGVTTSAASPLPEYTGAADAAEYYKDLPRNQLSKEEMWTRIQQKTQNQAEMSTTALAAPEAEYLKMEEELKEHDLFHYRIGERAFPDETMRRDYYAMWQLSMSLNKARWSAMEVHNQRGVKTTGVGMKSLFWKESIYQIAEQKDMVMGQFVDGHPVLRPFAAAVKRSPKITKTFIRGFADARLKVLQQPGNVKQLFDHFDRFYGYFFNTMLEILRMKDDHAEHAMCHIGRAIGISQHCVMFWKKYAKLGFTMLPADLCADHHVNLTLLKNIPLASKDRAVRRLLCELMSIAKQEMIHAQEAAKHCNPKVWPLLVESFYPNYYLWFLQKHEFNVSAMLADHNVENPGFAWYRLKKHWEWERYHDVQRLVAEPAPLPFIGLSIGHRGSSFKRAPSATPENATTSAAESTTKENAHGHSHGDGEACSGHSHTR